MSLATATMPQGSIGSATVVNRCARPVYYHVSGFKNGQGWDSETNLIPAQGFTMAYDTTISIKLFHDPAQIQGSISQLEFNLDKPAGRIWYDISNVDAFRTDTPPFMEGGMHLTTHGEQDGNCMPIYCEKGELICKDAYNSWNNDLTFVCPQATNLHLALCPEGPVARSKPAVPGFTQPAKGVSAAMRQELWTGKSVKVRETDEGETSLEEPDTVMIGGLTWETSVSSKSHVAKLPIAAVVAGFACYIIAML